jgi:hypothetical protein
MEPVAQDNRWPVRKGIPSADVQLAALIADAKEKLIDTRLRDRLVKFLEVARVSSWTSSTDAIRTKRPAC